MKTTSYEPKHLKRWTMPDNYFGEVWPNYYVFLGQNRGSDCLTRSNFMKGLEMIGGEAGEDDDGISEVAVVRERHWACGWVEWIAIHQDNYTALEIADRIAKDLENYPVIDEDHFSEMEMEEANEIWLKCHSPEERIKYMRDHQYQFERYSFTDLLAQARGKYFGGYASELIN